MHVVSRAEAKARGLKRYFTGKPCPHGHVAERQTSNKSCLICAAIGAQKYVEAHRTQVRAIKRRWAAKHPDYGREYEGKNRGRLRANHKKWRDANREMVREHQRKARLKLKNYYRAKCLERIARKRGAEGTYDQDDIDRIMKAQKGRCASPDCRERLDGEYHVDHVAPLAKGGSNWPRNLQLLCPACNSHKGAKDPIDFAREIGCLL